jgi:hypothetical protein
MSSAKKITLKKLKELNTIWHPESTLVFKSSEEKVVIGRYEDGELIPLDETSLELCSKWKFKYDKDLVEEDENEEDETQDEEKVDEKSEDEKETSEKEEIPDEEEKIEVKPEIIVKTEKSNKNEDNSTIRSLTSEMSEKIHSFFDKISIDYNTKILDLVNELIQKNKIIDDLEHKYNNSQSELDKLKTKFDGIKQLFSL